MNHFAGTPSEDESILSKSKLKASTSRTEHAAPPRRQHAPSSNGPAYLAAIGQRVRQARRLAGLSQHELAKRVGYTAANAISKLETGRMASIDVVMLDRVAEACGVSVRFLSGRPDAPDQQTELLTLLNRQARLLELMLTRLDAIEQQLGMRPSPSASLRAPARPS